MASQLATKRLALIKAPADSANLTGCELVRLASPARMLGRVAGQ